MDVAEEDMKLVGARECRWVQRMRGLVGGKCLADPKEKKFSQLGFQTLKANIILLKKKPS